MRQLVGRDPGAEFNLARKWAQWGHAGPAGVGAVVVWPHHVGMIVGSAAGTNTRTISCRGRAPMVKAARW